MSINASIISHEFTLFHFSLFCCLCLLLSTGEQFTADDHTLNLRRAFVDLENLSVSHQFLNGKICIKPGTAKNLHSILKNKNQF